MSQTDQFTMMLNLPEPVAHFVRAVNSGSTDAFLASFADDAVVVDVNRELRGLDAHHGLGRHRHLRGSRALRRLGCHRAPGANHRQSQDRRNVRSHGIARSPRDEPRVCRRRGEDHRTADRVRADTLMIRSLTGKVPRLEIAP